MANIEDYEEEIYLHVGENDNFRVTTILKIEYHDYYDYLSVFDEVEEKDTKRKSRDLVFADIKEDTLEECLETHMKHVRKLQEKYGIVMVLA